MIPGPPMVGVGEVERVGESGTPPMVAPLGMEAPMFTPLGPVPTAGPGPGRRPNSLGSGWRIALKDPVTLAGAPVTTKLKVFSVALVTVKTPSYSAGPAP